MSCGVVIFPIPENRPKTIAGLMGHIEYKSRSFYIMCDTDSTYGFFLGRFDIIRCI